MRMTLSKAYPRNIERFSAELSTAIGQLLPILRKIFEDFREGKAGTTVRGITLKLFDDWLASTLLPTVPSTVEYLKPLLSSSKLPLPVIVVKAKKAFPQFDNVERCVIDSIALSKQGRTIDESLNVTIWSMFEKQVETFLVQNAQKTAAYCPHYIDSTSLIGYTSITPFAKTYPRLKIGP
jgi:hypothetical protein